MRDRVIIRIQCVVMMLIIIINIILYQQGACNLPRLPQLICTVKRVVQLANIHSEISFVF